MEFTVDRSLPVPIRTQLQGLIEYGIACGELAPGEMLPSVRDLAEQAGVAPMTVSQVYRDLKAAGLIETRPGSGTFVTGAGPGRGGGRRDTTELHRRIHALLDEGAALGIGAAEIVSLVNASAFYRDSIGNRARVAMIGLFPEATASYARVIAQRLGSGATVEPLTIAALERDPDIRARANSADVVVTFANRRRDVAALVPNTKVVAVSFIPSEDTRRALASLDSLARVAAISRFPDFLPIMKAGILRFAPHVPEIEGAMLDMPDLDALLARSNAVIFATGAEAVAARVRPGVPAFEYRHAPDAADIERLVAPLLRTAANPQSTDKREAS